LVCEDRSAKKYVLVNESARVHSIKIVKIDWILECIAQATAVKEELFKYA